MTVVMMTVVVVVVCCKLAIQLEKICLVVLLACNVRWTFCLYLRLVVLWIIDAGYDFQQLINLCVYRIQTSHHCVI